MDFLFLFGIIALFVSPIFLVGANLTRPMWYNYLEGKVLGRKLVWLKCSEGEIVLTSCWTDPWGDVRAKWSSVRTVTLKDDGTVDGSYVKFWKPYN